MRELLSAKTQVHKKLQEYMQDFMQMKRSLNQSCEVGGNQLHQINVKLEAHRKERETFLEFSKKQVCSTSMKTKSMMMSGHPTAGHE